MSVHNCYDVIERALKERQELFDDFGWQLANESAVVSLQPPLDASLSNLTENQDDSNDNNEENDDEDNGEDIQNLETGDMGMGPYNMMPKKFPIKHLFYMYRYIPV